MATPEEDGGRRHNRHGRTGRQIGRKPYARHTHAQFCSFWSSTRVPRVKMAVIGFFRVPGSAIITTWFRNHHAHKIFSRRRMQWTKPVLRCVERVGQTVRRQRGSEPGETGRSGQTGREQPQAAPEEHQHAPGVAGLPAGLHQVPGIRLGGDPSREHVPRKLLDDTPRTEEG